MGDTQPDTSTRAGYELVTDYLSEADAGAVFTLLSGGIQHLVADIQDRGESRVVHARHEQTAVAMADGYSRVTDDVGVCVVGRGPGVAQTGTALLTARKRGSDVVVLVPDSAMSGSYRIDYHEKYDLKNFDLVPFLQSTVGTVLSITSQDMILPYLKEAFRRVRVGDGPVAVRVPEDVLNTRSELPAAVDEAYLVPDDGYGATDAVLRPDRAQIEAAVDAYLDADATKPPVILVGDGAVRSGARDAVADVAERTNALIASTLQGRGYLSDHPYYLGFVGGKGRMIANEYLSRTGFVLAVGCSMNVRTMDRFHLLDEDATVVHVDADPGAIDKYTPVDVGVTGDARAALRAFETELEQIGVDRSGAFWTDDLRREIEDAPDFDQREYPEQDGAIDPRDLIGALDDLLPEDRLLVHDGGQQNNWALDGIEIDHPDDFIWTMDFFSTGFALPVSIGAGLGATDRTVVSFAGDVGFMMSMQELDTAIRHDVPLLQFVMNNSAFGVEAQHLTKAGDHVPTALIDAPDFAAVADAMGAEGYTVRSLDDLAEIRDVLSRPPESPVVVDCVLNRNVVHREFA